MARPKREASRLLPATKVVKRPVEWLWEEHIPVGMVSIIAGSPEKGKSMLTSRIAADISHDFPVIMSTYEDPIAEVALPRLEAAGAVKKNVHFWRRGIRMPEDIRALRSEVDRLGVAMVVMDPISSHTRYSIYNATAIRDALGALVELADETDCAIVFVHHIIKKVDLKADPLSAVGGSGGGIGAMARVVYLFGESPDDPDERCLVQLKCNIKGRRPGLKFEMDVMELGDDVDAGFLELRGKHTLTPSQIFQARPQLDPTKYEAMAEFLVENLREGPMIISKLLDAAAEKGFTKRMARTVVDMLELEVVKTKWRLPMEFPR
jgi:AAA domain